MNAYKRNNYNEYNLMICLDPKCKEKIKYLLSIML